MYISNPLQKGLDGGSFKNSYSNIQSLCSYNGYSTIAIIILMNFKISFLK